MKAAQMKQPTALESARDEALRQNIERRGTVRLDHMEYRSLRLNQGWSKAEVDRSVDRLAERGAIFIEVLPAGVLRIGAYREEFGA